MSLHKVLSRLFEPPEGKITRHIGLSRECTSPVFDAWVWRMPPDSRKYRNINLIESKGLPPPPEADWELVRKEYGQFRSIRQAIPFIPQEQGEYVIAIGRGNLFRYAYVFREEDGALDVVRYVREIELK